MPKTCTFCDRELTLADTSEDDDRNVIETWKCECGSLAWYCGGDLMSCCSPVTGGRVVEVSEQDGWTTNKIQFTEADKSWITVPGSPGKQLRVRGLTPLDVEEV